MSADSVEGLGTLAEGAATARALEPARGDGNSGGRGHFHESACLNCGTEITGNYCSHCGQHSHLHRTMGAFLHDLIHGVLHLEGKTWRTVHMLALKPGKLTRDYIDGQRARYVSPMALYLFAVFAMFAVFSLASGEQATDGISSSATVNLENAKIETRKDRAARRAALDELGPGDPDRAELEAELATLDKDLKSLESLQLGKVDDLSAEFGQTALGPLVRKWRENPKLMLYKMQSTGYKFSWLLIPLSLPFVWLLFAWKRRVGAYDHAVFVTYSISFMSLLFIVVSLLTFAGMPSGPLVTAAAIIAPLHIYKQVKGGYALSRAGALWRTIALLVIALVVAILFLLILLAMGAMG